MTTADTPKLDPALARELHAPRHAKHGVRFSIFLLCYAVGTWGAFRLSTMTAAHPVIWIATVPLWILAGASLHGISLFAHEAVHGTLARNRVLNAVLGAASAIPVLQNCSAYKVLHLRHHSHLGEEGDPDHYANYTRWSWMVFIMNWLRLLIGYPVYITAIPILGFKHGAWRDRWCILAEALAMVALIGTAWHFLPHALLFQGWVMPMVFINFMVNVRGMSQHTLLPACHDEVRGTRSILTSRLVAFFMCNENYHLEHHLYPGVPWYHLPQVHEALHKELAEHGAPYIGSYSAFVREFVVFSFEHGPLGVPTPPKP